MKQTTVHQIQLGQRQIDYRVRVSHAAKKLRIRIGSDGIEVVRPALRNGYDVLPFLERNSHWILEQLRRIERLRKLRRPEIRKVGEILFHGEPTAVRIHVTRSLAPGNKVTYSDGELHIYRGLRSRTPVEHSLENWLRKQARAEIDDHLAIVLGRLHHRPGRVYVMGQRTKWGNCSSQRNLSFNWRMIFAPNFVLRYLVTHEAAHLAVPDHSAKFWLIVQSLCRDTERAKQWLVANGRRLLEPLAVVT